MRAEIERPELESAIEDIEEDYQAARANVTEEEEEEIIARLSRPDAEPASEAEELVYRRYMIVKRKGQLTTDMSRLGNKQGKFIYTHAGGQARVYRRYEGRQTVMQPLYAGPL